MQSWWLKYETSEYFFSPTPIVLVYHFIIAIWKSQRSVSYRTFVVDRYYYVLLSVFTPAFIAEPFNSANVFEGTTNFADLYLFRPSPSHVQYLVSEVCLLSVLREHEITQHKYTLDITAE